MMRKVLTKFMKILSHEYLELYIILWQLEAKQLLLYDLDHEILSLCKLADVDGEIDKSETITAKTIQYKGKLESALHPSQPAAGVMEVTALPDSATISNMLSVYSAKACLSELMPSKFHGDVTAWTTFWDSFKAAAHDNTELT